MLLYLKLFYVAIRRIERSEKKPKEKIGSVAEEKTKDIGKNHKIRPQNIGIKVSISVIYVTLNHIKVMFYGS